ncbi:Ig-like domain repeat protein [Rhodococcus maanshanensis]|uniref:Ig-like domain (Group 3) n=2 Tax=Rhodococcus maanshanensis TaxID=183556 RepID=A0A1H7J7N4_9NOCA|nr:Ig-like domain repeat protein [Rhodococcus maanshanensis]SEK70232.1 Ig-like domain (group 3) [Rhodococcus maanshanensis]
MAHRATTRTVAATALALGALTIFGTGVANAAPATISWDIWNGTTLFTRTVSNATPAVGETITVSTKFARNDSYTEKISWIKDHHDSCLTYVPGSAKLTNNLGTHPVEPYLEITPDFVAGDFNPTSYQVTISQNDPATFSAQYTVGADCDLGTALGSGMSYSGSRTPSDFSTKGPAVTVTKANTTTTLNPITGAKVGTATTLTATVTGAATGNTVEFYDGTTKIGQNTLGANGTGTYQWTPTTAGQHTLTAKFPSTDTANASQSAPQTTTVTAAGVASTITLAPVTGAKEGTATTLTATVNPAAAGGTVTFKDDEFDMDTVQVGADGTITYEWTPGWDGQHTITATFSGRNGVTGSTTTQQVTVAPAGSTASTTTLTPITGATANKATTLKAKVTPAAAGGTIEFKDGDTVLGTAQVGANGEATHQWTPTTEGQRTITATFSGRNGITGSATTQQVTVAKAGTNPEGNGSTGSLGSLLGGFGS